MTLRQAAEMALEWIEKADWMSLAKKGREVRDALRAALDEPEREADGWIVTMKGGIEECFGTRHDAQQYVDLHWRHYKTRIRPFRFIDEATTGNAPD